MTASQEIRRLRYLQAMGVPVYVSRRNLPGARVSRRLGLRAPQPPAPPAAAAPVASARAALRESLARPQPGRHATGPATPEAPPAEASPAASTGERFSIAAVISGGRLWVEDLGSEALAVEQLQLMAAIGRALSHPQCDAEAPRVAQFDWPLHDNPQLDLGPAEARAALESFLRRQIGEHGCASVMCCGEAVAARLGAAALPVPVHRLPDSRSLLRDPARKRELWTRLRA
jgi:hypothetical protein